VQARVAATGAGTIAAYKEPTGPGVREPKNRRAVIDLGG